MVSSDILKSPTRANTHQLEYYLADICELTHKVAFFNTLKGLQLADLARIVASSELFSLLPSTAVFVSRAFR